MDLTTATLYLFCVSIVLAVVYDQLTTRIPSRLRETEKPKSGFGLVRADRFSAHDEPARAHGIDIIFVHGLGSNPDTTWGSKDSNWVNEFLPQDIPAAFHKDIRIFFYNYDSYWKRDAVQTRLRSLGESLLGDIESGIRGTEDECTRSLVFVGHSHGGLVIKQVGPDSPRPVGTINEGLPDQALIQASTGVAELTKAVFFLGTPHRGSSFSIFGSFVAQLLQPLGSNPLLLQELVSDSYFLLDLQKDFERFTIKTLRVVNFFEQRPTRLLKLWFIQWAQFCVKEQSATYGKENFGLSVDHYGLNKYTSREDENYKRIVGKLLDTIAPIALQKQHRLYSVPVTTARSYVERRSLSTAIEEMLHVHHQGASVPHALVIHGLGGTGKTQLARKYVEEHKDEYNPILWIDAMDEASVRASFERCVGELRLPVDQGVTQTAKLVDSPAVQAVLRWFRNRKKTDERWLVVIDNADDAAIGIQSVIPEGSRGSIIITSQDRHLSKCMRGYEEVAVGVMEPLEAQGLLLRHLELEASKASENTLEDCNEIARELGYLALAVDLAGAYISNNRDDGQALRQYLVDYKKHQDDLLQSEEFRGLLPSSKTVWTVWDTTLERIKKNGKKKHADLLLAFLAHFRGAVIHDELFRMGSLAMTEAHEKLYGNAMELPDWLDKILTVEESEWDDYSYRQSRGLLERYALLQRTEGRWPGVSMHGLVQWRAKKYEEQQPWGKWHLMTVVAGCVQQSMDAAKPEYRRELVAHVPTLEERDLDELDVGDNRKEFVWNAVGTVYSEEGRWKEAEEMFVQVVEARKRVLGDKHPSTLISITNLASTYSGQGKWKEAEELEVQVIETGKRVLGDEHSFTLTSMANLASTYRNQGHLKEAEKLGVQVIETNKRVLGDEHPSMLSSMANLASTYRGQGRWKEAEELEVQVMEGRKRMLGDEHPSTLRSIANLALTYNSQGQWKEAEKLGVQVIETTKRVLGDEHPDTLSSMANLASTYKSQARWKEAEELEVRVMEARKRVLGDEHPSTLRSIANLASTYKSQGRRKEAEELSAIELQIFSDVIRDERPSTLSGIANLASIYRSQGRWELAEVIEVQVMKTFKRMLGDEHLETLNSMANLASTYRSQGRWREAEELEARVMETRKRVLG